MKSFIVPVSLAALLWLQAFSSPFLPFSEPQNHVLMIDLCSARVPGGKATLSIGPLQPRSDIYAGDYRMKVSPYFFKGEKGKLAITIPSDTLERVSQGQAVDITGTATTDGESVARHIDITATPSDSDHGALMLWFVVDGRKMTFNTAYHIVRADSPQTSVRNRN